MDNIVARTTGKMHQFINFYQKLSFEIYKLKIWTPFKEDYHEPFAVNWEVFDSSSALGGKGEWKFKELSLPNNHK